MLYMTCVLETSDLGDLCKQPVFSKHFLCWEIGKKALFFIENKKESNSFILLTKLKEMILSFLWFCFSLLKESDVLF